MVHLQPVLVEELHPGERGEFELVDATKDETPIGIAAAAISATTFAG